MNIGETNVLSPEAAVYFCKSATRPCMVYCSHVLTGIPNCHLNMLAKLQKRICRTAGHSLVASLEPSAQCSCLKSSVGIWRIFIHSCSRFTLCCRLHVFFVTNMLQILDNMGILCQQFLSSHS